jgi:hypothetical protein
MAKQNSGLGRTVNSLLGQKPSLGPIPGDQVIPWTIMMAFWMSVKLFIGIPWTWAGGLLFWSIAVWWILTGKKAWRFLNRFVRCPKWAKTYRRYESPLDE